jgi:replicative DNA helicase
VSVDQSNVGAPVENRIPPHSMEAEAAVISAALCGDQLPRMVAMLRPEDFYSEAHRRIFEACVALHAGGSNPDVVQVATWLRDAARLEQVGGMAYLTEVLNAAPAAANAVAYARTVRVKARRRATVAAAQAIASEGYAATGGGDDADYLARSAATMAAATRMPDAEALKSNADALRTIVLNIQRAATTGSTVTGLPTGLDRYDRLTLGLHGTQLTVIAARPGVGKTSIGANIAANIARTGVGVLFFSLEMSRAEILSRQLASIGRIDGTHLKTGRLTPTGWERLHSAAKSVAGLPLWIDERTGLTVSDIANTALGAIEESAARKTALGLIVVDYLQKIGVPEKDRRKQRYEAVGDIAKGLKQLARDTGMPVIALAQLRRLGKAEKGKRPTMDDLRESGDIESEADVVTLLHEPDDEDDRGQGGTKDLIIEKARGGRTGVVRVAWRPELTLFENLPDGVGGAE